MDTKTLVEVLKTPVLPLPLDAKYIQPLSSIKNAESTIPFYIALPHYGKKNILIVGQEGCFACKYYTHLLGGYAQQFFKCMVYTIEYQNIRKEKHLEEFLKEETQIPIILIEDETNMLSIFRERDVLTLFQRMN